MVRSSVVRAVGPAGARRGLNARQWARRRSQEIAVQARNATGAARFLPITAGVAGRIACGSLARFGHFALDQPSLVALSEGRHRVGRCCLSTYLIAGRRRGDAFCC